MTAARVFDRKPKPRVLFYKVPKEVQARLEGFFPTVGRVASFDGVFAREWELVITTEGDTDVPGGLHVVSFGGVFFSSAKDQANPYPLGRAHQSASGELVLPPGLPAEVEQLVRSEVLPQVRLKRPHCLTHTYMGSFVPSRSAIPVRAFLSSGDGHPLLGAFEREKGGSCWSLLEQSDPVRWTRVALGVLRATEPDKFPVPWDEQVEWLTPSEERATERQRALVIERQEVIDRLDQADLAAIDALDDARREAVAGPRRLVTAQGDELVSAVAEALRAIGFVVEEMDAKVAAGDRREDLRLTVPSSAEWEAIVEVKGYTGGAAVGDLMKLERFARRYEQEKGRSPDAVWYVCNQFLEQPPSSRQDIFATSRQDVAVYEEERPLFVLDTRDLFRSWKVAQDDATIAEDFRRRLQTGRGVFQR